MNGSELNKYCQAAKEARWALYMTIFYMAGWYFFAYIPNSATGLLSLPLWFELSCILLPIIFLFLAYAVLKLIYKNIDIDTP